MNFIIESNFRKLDRAALIARASDLRNTDDYRNVPAKYRLQYARHLAASADFFADKPGSHWEGYKFEHDGFFIEVKVEADEYDDRYYGAFSDTEGEVINPNWSYRSYGYNDTLKWFTPESGTTVDELAEWNSKSGMPKHDARLKAIASLQSEARMASNEDGGPVGIIVTVLDEEDGTELGEQSLWGNYIDSDADLYDIIFSGHGLVDEAIDQARDSIKQAEERTQATVDRRRNAVGNVLTDMGMEDIDTEDLDNLINAAHS